MVRGKKRRQGGGRERSEKDTFAFLLLERKAHPTSSFSESPPSNHATMSKYQLRMQHFYAFFRYCPGREKRLWIHSSTASCIKRDSLA
ncbi:hypothetical protein P9597_11820 [Aneurinibacillus migulanus]|uniref:hypothetical protein n=1 Tax=Aneurinibacillus migulanus TaxID=47500 RepID=UPI002E1D901E|nr:hypothetical protein [Aneurinibacillus migulanus]